MDEYLWNRLPAVAFDFAVENRSHIF